MVANVRKIRKSSKNSPLFPNTSVVAGASMGDQSVLLFVHIGGKDLYYDALRVIVPTRRITLRAELDSYVLLSKSPVVLLGAESGVRRCGGAEVKGI